MNIFAIIFLSIAAAIGLFAFFGEAAPGYTYGGHKGWTPLEGLRSGAGVLAVCVGVVMVVWAFVAWPLSTFSENSCRNEADGYNLDYDWSIRNGCRVYLPSGQLVPLDNIRVTSDGDIIKET